MSKVIIRDQQFVTVGTTEQGPPGKSTYELAVQSGYVGTLEDWLNDQGVAEISQFQQSVDTLSGRVGTAEGEIDMLQSTLKARPFAKASVSEMKSDLSLTAGDYVSTAGYYTSGDGGGNDYLIVSAGTGTDDDGSFIDLDSGLQAKGLFIDQTHVRPIQFGGGWDGFKAAYKFSKWVELEPDVEYVVNSSWPKALAESVDIIGNGAAFKVVSGGNGPDICGSVLSPIDVMNISKAGFDDRFTMIEVSDASGIQSGSLLKIFSDEAAAEYTETERQEPRKGEFLSVSFVDENYVYIAGQLSFDYNLATFPAKIVVVENVHVKITDIDVYNDTGLNATLIRLEALRGAHLENVRCRRNYEGRFLWVHSCYGCTFDSTHVNFISDQSQPDFSGSAGYGIWFLNSENCKVSNSDFNAVRHGVDANGHYGASSQYPSSKYGLTAGHLITNCSGQNCHNAPFGTHFGSRNITFSNIRTSNNRHSGVGLRGSSHRVDGWTSFQDNTPFSVFSGGDGNTKGMVISNATIQDPTGSASINGTVAVSLINVDYIFHKDFKNTDRIIEFVDDNAGKLVLRNVRLESHAAFTYGRLDFIRCNYSGGKEFIELDGVTFDFADATIPDRWGIIRASKVGGLTDYPTVRIAGLKAYFDPINSPLESIVTGDMDGDSALLDMFISHDPYWGQYGFISNSYTDVFNDGPGIGPLHIGTTTRQERVIDRGSVHITTSSTLEVNKRYLVDGSIVLTLPSADVGDTIYLMKQSGTSTINGPIVYQNVSDTVLEYDLDVGLTLVFDGTNWRVE